MQRGMLRGTLWRCCGRRHPSPLLGRPAPSPENMAVPSLFQQPALLSLVAQLANRRPANKSRVAAAQRASMAGHFFSTRLIPGLSPGRDDGERSVFHPRGFAKDAAKMGSAGAGWGIWEGKEAWKAIASPSPQCSFPAGWQRWGDETETAGPSALVQRGEIGPQLSIFFNRGIYT